MREKKEYSMDRSSRSRYYVDLKIVNVRVSGRESGSEKGGIQKGRLGGWGRKEGRHDTDTQRGGER